MKRVQINPNKISLGYLDVDELGFNCFKLCRSSEKELFEDENDPDRGYAHTFDYQVFTLYGPKLGRIQVQTFHLRWNWTAPVVSEDAINYDTSSPYLVHLVGQK